MPKISIIVPVYKAEEYLERCIHSILGQRFRDFELILVDDGSPDGCPGMCDAFAAEDARVRVIHQRNAGVSAARNAGLDIADGEYVTFVDSDDYIDPQMYEEMMRIAGQFDCDVVMCDCVKEFGDHTEVYSHDIRPGYYGIQQLKEEYYPHLLVAENVEYPPTISNWLCLFRLDRLEKNIRRKIPSELRKSWGEKLRYLNGVRFSEDLLFGAQMMYLADSFYYMKGQVYYHYCMNSGSASHSFAPDKWEDYKTLHGAAETYFMALGDWGFPHQLDLLLLLLVYNTLGDIRSANQLPASERADMIYTILREPKVRGMFRRIRVWDLPNTWKLKAYTWMLKYRVGIRLLIKG